MPIVPRVTRQVTPDPLPGVRRSPSAPEGAFGGPRLPDLSGVANAANRIAEQAKQHADGLAVQEADNHAADVYQTLLTDPDTGLVARKGKASLSALDDIGGAWKDQMQSIESRLTNDDQREEFRKRAMQRGTQLYGLVQEHTAREMATFQSEQDAATVANAQADAVTDPRVAPAKVATIRQTLAARAQREGWSDVVLTHETNTAVAQTHDAVVSDLLAKGQPAAARSYFEAVQADVVGPARTHIEAALKEGETRIAAQQASDRILAEGGTVDQQRAKAKQLTGEVRDQTLAYVEHEHALHEQEHRQSIEDASTAASNLIEKTGTVTSIAPATWAAFPESTKSALRGYAASLAKGEPIKTDLTTYYALRTEASAPETQGKFLARNLLDYKDALSPSDFEAMVGVQAELRKSGQSRALGDWRSLDDVVNGRLQSAGFDISPKATPDDRANVERFRRSVDLEVQQFEARTGKKPGAADMQSITDDLLVQGVVQGTGFLNRNTTEPRRAFARQPGERLILSVTDVPLAARQQIEARLRTVGRPVTDQAIVSAYVQRINRLPVAAP